MTIELSGIDARHERRLRLVFTSPLASGAFGAPAPTYYVVDNLDGLGASPGIDAALIVSGATSNVELALDSPLTSGALYQVSAIGVPGADLSTSTSLSIQQFRFGTPQTIVNVEAKASDADVLLFGRDLSWSGDYLETPDGDLATVEGSTNAYGALYRRCLGFPLAWAPDYSARAYDSVDAPLAGALPLRSRLQAQCLRDRRCQSVKVAVVEDPANQASSTFQVTPVLVSGTSPGAIKVPISVQS